MTQAIFLTSVLGGIVSLVAAIGLARFHWRADVAPFGRETSTFSVLTRPASYATPGAVSAIRMLTLAGCALLAVALGCLIYQLVADVAVL